MPYVCTHRGQFGTHTPKGTQPHQMCDRCRLMSVSPRNSDYWVCCICHGVRLYDPQARKARKRKQPRDSWAQL